MCCLCRVVSLISVFLLFAVSPTFAVSLQVDSGQLIGATGVAVGGTLYDVVFVDGTCAAVFTGCDSVTDFTFTNSIDARAAAAALLNQVFLDGLSGNFDTDPELINGCTATAECETYIPFALTIIGTDTRIADNNGLAGNAFDEVRSGVVLDTTDFSNFGNANWAVFSLSGNPGPVVPEPSTMLLFGSGIAGLIGWQYRKKHLT